MAKVVIHPIPGGQINILIPVGTLPVEEVAKKDVPEGVPYLIIDESNLPKDRTYRAAWTADFTVNDGVGLGHQKWLELNGDKYKQIDIPEMPKFVEVPNDQN